MSIDIKGLGWEVVDASIWTRIETGDLFLCKRP